MGSEKGREEKRNKLDKKREEGKGGKGGSYMQAGALNASHPYFYSSPSCVTFSSSLTVPRGESGHVEDIKQGREGGV